MRVPGFARKFWMMIEPAFGQEAFEGEGEAGMAWGGVAHAWAARCERGVNDGGDLFGPAGHAACACVALRMVTIIRVPSAEAVAVNDPPSAAPVPVQRTLAARRTRPPTTAKAGRTRPIGCPGLALIVEL